LLRLNFGIFTLHLLLTATFVAVPLAFARRRSAEREALGGLPAGAGGLDGGDSSGS